MHLVSWNSFIKRNCSSTSHYLRRKTVSTEENSTSIPESVQVEMYEALLKLSYERGVMMGILYGGFGFGAMLWAMALMAKYM
jgi:hypothetical protein